MAKPKPVKGPRYHGSGAYSRISPPNIGPDTKSLNIYIPFEEALKLSVAIQAALLKLNSYMGLYFRLLDHNLKTPDAVSFVRDLHKELQKPILLVWDLLNVHRSAAKELLRRAPRWLAIEWLPPYAPDLDPVEHVWNHAKYADLANYVPDDIEALGRRVRGSLCSQRSNPDGPRALFAAAKLPL